MAQKQFITGLTHVLPAQSGISSAVTGQIYTQLARDAGVWGIIALIVALFNGSRLFVQLEGFLDFIYHRPERAFLKQNGMAFLMLLLFVILIPIMTAAATGPTLIFTLLKSTPIGKDKPISDQAQKAGLVNVPGADNQDVRRIQARKPGGERSSAPSTSTQQGHLQQTQQDQHDRHDQHKHVHEKNEQAQTPTSKMAIVAEAVAGTGLAYLVELWRMRQKKP
jgi:hypothetical protein